MERFVPWRSLSKSMQSTLQSQPGQSQPSSSGGTASIVRSNRTMSVVKLFETWENKSYQNNYQQDNWILLSSFNRGGSKHNWWNPRSQAPSQRIISLSAGRSLAPHLAQNICRRIKMPELSNYLTIKLWTHLKKTAVNKYILHLHCQSPLHCQIKMLEVSLERVKYQRVGINL